VMSKSQERMFESDFWRVRGELALAAERAALPIEIPSAADCFHRAIGVARAQGAKFWELRAVMSLARLVGGGTFALLSEIYGWFTEGLDTRDLREARDLLEKSLASETKET
jgi:adenylate cyclase